MIRVEAVLDEAGLMRSCTVQGHAGAGPKGSDVVCAAVSILCRTALKILSESEGITVRGDAPQRGVFWLETESVTGDTSRLDAVGSFLLEGLDSVSREYPDHCSMQIRRERRQQHGS